MKILILGFSKTGRAVYDFIQKNGKNEIYIYDKNKIKIRNYISYNELKKRLPHFDLVIRSPGIKMTSKVYQLALILGNKLVSEIEYALKYIKDNKVIGVTGSNGKTTLVKMIENKLKGKYRVHVLGNIGTPLISQIGNIKKEDIVILELSSFQLENTYSKYFDIGVITNITDNHFDHVFTKECYYASKLKLIDLSKTIYMSNSIKYHRKKKKVIYIEDLPVIENKELNYFNQIYWNIACSIARKFHVDDNVLLDNNHFNMEPFRTQFIKEYKKLIFINDSKSTSIASCNGCLNIYKDKPRIIILGGISKKENFSTIHKNKDDYVLSFGKDKIKIFRQIGDLYFDNLNLLMKYIKKHFINKEYYVIFSPACASFDQFSSYLDRGEKFNRLVSEYFS